MAALFDPHILPNICWNLFSIGLFGGWWAKSSDAYLEELKWPTLELCHRYLTILMHDSLNFIKQSPIDPNNRFQFNDCYSFTFSDIKNSTIALIYRMLILH